MHDSLKPDHVLIDDRGKPEAVVLSLVKYRHLVDLLEDRADARPLKQAIRTSRGTVTHEQLLRRLKN